MNSLPVINDVFHFEICSFLGESDLGKLSRVSKELNNEVEDDMAWTHVTQGLNREEAATKKLIEFANKHYDMSAKYHRNTETNMHVKSWVPEYENHDVFKHFSTRRETKELDVLERVLVRNIVRRNVPKSRFIEIMVKHDEPNEQMGLLKSILMKPDYIMGDDDLTDILSLIDISEYANEVRLATLVLYYSVAANGYVIPDENHYRSLIRPANDYMDLWLSV